ncbi:hypothetical protein HG535_0D05660 [Zygotorulaspora mrakii]|uniref:Trafficking protein particle complex subunit n=1 Tax=Zygotorulaspora mrakii TaxID=42260 RepID=A0A7H9B2Z0_ZYGMR|nr:uncharacterized protein HG535_0D05660 [Zygotorulaspora mrakii]QLG72857.1 hypothetical protein HG535_0D05660 [Zygotorulaspora mrakii]
MSQRIILPSTSDDRVFNNSDGYEYTIGPKQSLPNEASSQPTPSRLYSESLMFRKQEVSLSAVTFLFGEMIAHIHNTSKTASECEVKLNDYGFVIGSKLLELLNLRASVPSNTYLRSSNFLSSSTPTNTSANAMHSGSNTTASRTVSGVSDIYYNQENSAESLTTLISSMRSRDLTILDILQFIHGTVWSYLFGHVSDDLVKSSERENEYMIVDNLPLLTQFIPNGVSCDFFVCGIIQGFLNNAEFPCSVTPHLMPLKGFDQRVIYLIQFDKHVLEREGLRSE